MIRFIDLFAGTGGTRLGFESACKQLNIPAKCVFTSEIDPKAQVTYQTNFGELPSGDICTITNIPDFDFLLAGFPCQPFSYAGKQKGFGDTRGTLFFEIVRILKDKTPKAFLLENVRGLLTHDHGRTIKTIVHELEALGYGVSILLLNSSNFGCPQNRVRIYICGLIGDKPMFTIYSNPGPQDSHTFKKERHQTNKLLVKDIIEQKVEEKYYCSAEFTQKSIKLVGGDVSELNGLRYIDYRNGKSVHSWELGIKGECSQREIDLMNNILANRRLKKFGSQQDGKKLTKEQISTFWPYQDLEELLASLLEKKYLNFKDGRYNPNAGNMSFEVFKILDLNSIAITVVASDAHRLGVVQNGRIRHLTPRECARLQGFPDSFVLPKSDTIAYKQLGNAVSVPVIAAVSKNLIENNKPKISG